MRMGSDLAGSVGLKASHTMVQSGETATRNYCHIYSALLAMTALLLTELKRSHA
jgi:hypothetical protein